MKKYIRFSIIVFLILLGVNYVNALSCDANDIKRLKVLANNVDITYEYNDDLKDSDGFIIYDTYKVVINNISDELYVVEAKSNIDFRDYPINDSSIVVDRMFSGKKTFKVYSKNCDKSLKTIYETLPSFNYYSMDSNCEGKENLEICQKFYDTSDLKYYEFLNIIDEDNNEEKIDNDDVSTISKYVEFIKDNGIYFGVGIGILFVLIVIIFALKHKKRGVLE